MSTFDVANDLAKEHWSYVSSVLSAHNVDPKYIEPANHHYMQAFIHGYKHGIEDHEDIVRLSPLGEEDGEENNGAVCNSGTIKKSRKLRKLREFKTGQPGEATL